MAIDLNLIIMYLVPLSLMDLYQYGTECGIYLLVLQTTTCIGFIQKNTASVFGTVGHHF